jgi:CRP-like cAMP-binding protein
VTLDAEVAQLAQTRPFSLLPREALQLVAFASEKRRLRAGETLFQAGEQGEAGFFVHSGAIALLEKGVHPENPRRVGAGALIGENALYAPVARRVEARAIEDSLVAVIPRAIFRRVLTEFPDGADKVRAALAGRTRRLLDGLDAARARSFAIAPRVRPAP